MANVKQIGTSIFLWLVGLLWLIPVMGILTLVQQIIPSDRIDFITRFYCRVQIFLTGSRWRAVIHPTLDPKKTYLFVQNHTNHFDHVAMYNATPHFKQGLELETHFRFPFYGWFMKSRGTIPVPASRNQRTDAIFEGIKKEVSKGHSVLAFPEGTRTLDGKVGPFKTGVFFVAQKLGLEVVPVAVSGMHRMMKKGSLHIHPGNTLTVFVDQPISLKDKSEQEVKDIALAVQQTIAHKVEEQKPPV